MVWQFLTATWQSMDSMFVYRASLIIQFVLGNCWRRFVTSHVGDRISTKSGRSLNTEQNNAVHTTNNKFEHLGKQLGRSIFCCRWYHQGIIKQIFRLFSTLILSKILPIWCWCSGNSNCRPTADPLRLERTDMRHGNFGCFVRWSCDNQNWNIGFEHDCYRRGRVSSQLCLWECNLREDRVDCVDGMFTGFFTFEHSFETSRFYSFT